MKPRNFEENVIWYSIIGTYGFYFTGLLYYVGPVIIWVLAFYLVKKRWIQKKENAPADQSITIPLIVWVWLVSMAAIEVAIIFSHADFNLGLARLIKSSIGWAKGWALFALCPLVGCLDIRPKLISRAICILSIQSLIFLAFCYAAFLLGINFSYQPPLNLFGGADLAFRVSLYNVVNGWLRISLFAPWTTIIGFVGNIYFPLCLHETNRRWRWIGLASSLLMIWFSGSRTNIIAFPLVCLLTPILANLKLPILWIAASFSSLVTGILAPNLLSAIESFLAYVRSLRENSNDAREAIDELALKGWSEAPLTGNGITEVGPDHLVGGIKIGTHNNWTSLLFLYGVVGFLALAVPMLCTFINLVVKAQNSRIRKTALHVLLIIFFNSRTDSFNMSTYITFPGLIFLGTALKMRNNLYFGAVKINN